MSETGTNQSSWARLPLWAGVLACPFFLSAVLLQSAVRPGFELARHPLSLLALGEYGWVQALNFVTTGLLAIIFGIGIRQATRTNTVPVALAVYGLGLVGAAIFPAEPAMGFPPGMPAGQGLSFSAQMHGAAFMLAHLGILCACIAYARRALATKKPGLALFSVATALAIPTFIAAGFVSGTAVGGWFFALGVAVLFWVLIVALHVLHRPRSSSIMAGAAR